MDKSNATKVERVARLKWVPIPKCKFPDIAQREKINQARVDKIAADFDLEQLGTPTVNERDGSFYVMDGMHRIQALKQIGWGDQQIQCWTYADLTDEQMAERFLKLNDTLAVGAFDKFRIGINAGREVETDIDRIVRAQGLHVSRDESEGAVRAIGTLRKVYDRGGPYVLARTLGLIRESYGTPGFQAVVIDGLSLLCQRYNGVFDETVAVEQLGSVRGGVNGLTGKAESLRLKTGNQKAPCVAAAAVDIINRGRRGEKLPSWWKNEDDQTS